MFYIKAFLAFITFIVIILYIGIAYSDLSEKKFSWHLYLIILMLFILLAIAPTFITNLLANSQN